MKAYNVEYGTKVVVVDNDIITPVGSLPIKKGDEITIYRPDGMYCNGEDANGNRIYIFVTTEVEPI